MKYIMLLTLLASLSVHTTFYISDPYKLARKARVEKHFHDCLVLAKRAEHIDPSALGPVFYEGLCAERVGRFLEAYNAFEHARRIDPTDSDTYNNISILAIKMVRIQQARIAIQQFQSRFPKDPRLSMLRRLLAGLIEVRSRSKLSDTEIRRIILFTYLKHKRDRVLAQTR